MPHTCRYVMIGTNQDATKNAKMFLKTISILSDLNDEQLDALANNMEEIQYKDTEYVVAMGDVADALFFIKVRSVRSKK